MRINMQQNKEGCKSNEPIYELVNTEFHVTLLYYRIFKNTYIFRGMGYCYTDDAFIDLEREYDKVQM